MNHTPPLLIETENLSFHYGTRPILHQVALGVPAGSVYGFLGPNGAGKSTTMRLLLGLLRPSSGTVRLFGHDMARHRLALLARVGALIENPSLYDHLTGRENVEATRYLRGLPAHRTAEVLDLVGLTEHAHRPAREYSLGMRQRLGLALALLPDPEVLLLDEPTNGLDPNGIMDMRALLRRLSQEHGKTILVSSHLISEIEKVATHVGMLQQGRLVFQGSCTDLRRLHTGRARLVLETPDAQKCREQLPQLLAEAVVTAPGTLHLPWRSAARTAEVAAAVVGAGLPLYGLHQEQPTLEDTFLHLTETALTL